MNLNLEQHAYGMLYPEMDEAQFQSFIENVTENGFQNPIIYLYEGKILDGWHRYQAALTIQECDTSKNMLDLLIFREFNRADPLAFVHSINGYRRHLTQAQLAVIALKHTKMKQVGRPDKKIVSDDTIKSSTEIAQVTGTSRETVQRAKRAMQLAPEKIDDMVEGTVTPTQIIDQDRDKQIKQTVDMRQLARQSAKRKMKAQYPALPEKQYDIIYADPPWDYEGQVQHSGEGGPETGGAVVHYRTLTLVELEALNVSSLANPDCLLFLWTTGTHLDQAIELGRAWGFDYKQVAFVWDKQRTNPGHYTLTQCEYVLVFKRKYGTRPDDRLATPRQFVSEMRGKHSAKPKEVANRIVTMYPEASRIELFARDESDDFDVWGNEVS